VANLSNEVERLNQVLRRKLDENDSLTARLTEAEKQSRSVIELQSRISIITREKETLVLEAQKNLSELPKQQEKLNSAVR
jgi:chorismate-pyruvate lyase